MIVKVETFDINNLFSRFNFSASTSEIQERGGGITVRYEFTEEDNFRLRNYRGSLVKAKLKGRPGYKKTRRTRELDKAFSTLDMLCYSFPFSSCSSTGAVQPQT